VGADKINHFVAKLRFHRCSCGVLFAREGITGQSGSGLSAARLTQLRWHQQDGCTAIVVSEQDLQQLRAGDVTFSDMLLGGYESVRFSLSR